MKQKYLKLAKNFSVEAREYASQANGDLGIRDSGKTYTAMKVAEQLLIAKIPIIVYDPSGVWKNIRSGVNGKKGFPVIVAGGDSSADIILTADNSVQIVRAAMRSGISIILDLYSPSLANKSTWNKIVHDTMEVLMYENSKHGLRHIFLEEAAEFVPQRIMPQQARVYSSIERVVRIGRNASLGITIINQRAEEVNKAVFELCALVFLHKQVGKNSLLSIKKWFDVSGWNKDNVNAMVSQLPFFNKGECLIVNRETSIGGIILKSHILPKQTFHPSPEKGVPKKSASSTVNISEFIKKLNAELNKDEKKDDEVSSKISASKKGKMVDLVKQELKVVHDLRKEVSEKNTTIMKLSHDCKEYSSQLEVAKKEIAELIRRDSDNTITIEGISKQLSGHIRLKSFTSKVKEVKLIRKPTESPRAVTPMEEKLETKIISTSNKDSAINRMIRGVAMFPVEGITKQQLAILTGMAVTSGTFGVYLRKLIRNGFVEKINTRLIPSKAALDDAEKHSNLIDKSLDGIINNWIHILGEESGLSRIFEAVAHDEGREVDIATIQSRANMVASSGTFGVYKRKLRRYGLIEIGKTWMKLSPNLIMPK